MKGISMPEKKFDLQEARIGKQYMEVSEAVLALWNTPYEALDAPTRFGTTRIHAAGSKANPAMILSPGFGANSTMWFPNIAALSSRFRVYAVDTTGQPGKSLPG
jgi:pimeloyl-ACP methyl ester carboxylesterase